MPTIDQAAFLRRERESILDAARTALTRMHTPHYQSIGEETVRERLSALFDMVVDGLAARDLGPIVAYAEQVATERFEAGYDLTEVQVAFNALEEATWASVLHELDPSAFPEAIGLISTVLGVVKDALAHKYVSLAADTRVTSLDLRVLFGGTS